jgi:hypothetical protein
MILIIYKGKSHMDKLISKIIKIKGLNLLESLKKN